MRRLCLVATAAVTTSLVLFATGCRSDGDAAEDGLLSGTTWTYEFLDLTPSTDMEEDSFVDVLANIVKFFPDLEYAAGAVREVDTSVPAGGGLLRTSAELKFGVGRCEYEERSVAESTQKLCRDIYREYIFAAAEYYNPNAGYLRVRTDGIFLLRDGMEQRVMTLDNFRMERCEGRTVVSEEECSEVVSEMSVSFSFKRSGSRVEFSGDGLEWEGVIDLESDTMDVTQVSPESKNIHIFTLRP